MANGHKAATAHQNRKRESSPIQRCVIRPAVYGAADDEFAGVRLSHPDKVLYPDQGLTKRDLAKYYAQVADWMLPHVIIAAREVRLLLEELGLTSFLKTTGGKGLHLVVPIQPRAEWDEAKAFCRAVADFVVRAAPDRFIATMSKAARTGKIFIDYLRNGRGSSAVAPYSTRAKPGATVSAPIAWEELTSSLHSDHDRKPAGPPEQAREGPVGRRAADKTIDHRRDGEAP